MLLKTQILLGRSVHTADNEDIGRLDDFLFDDQTWTIRYLVVDTGSWLIGRKVLLSPESLNSPLGAEADVVPVNLTKEQVENSPEIDLHKPVSRQNEASLHDYYGWGYYWMGAPGALGHGIAGSAAISMPISDEPETQQQQDPSSSSEETEETGDPNLRSIKEVIGYHINASDDEIGHVEDFFIDTAAWKIQFMLVDTRNWLPGRDVLVSPDWIDRVSWEKSMVFVDVTREQVEDSPEYDPKEPVTQDFESDLHHYYGYPFHP